MKKKAMTENRIELSAVNVVLVYLSLLERQDSVMGLMMKVKNNGEITKVLAIKFYKNDDKKIRYVVFKFLSSPIIFCAQYCVSLAGGYDQILCLQVYTNLSVQLILLSAGGKVFTLCNLQDV